MEQIELSIALFVIIATVGILFRNSTVPSSLLLVIVGMGLSLIPGFPKITVHPELIFDLFLPLLLYEASAYSIVWKDVKFNLRPIISLSVGHVIFITFLVAITINYLLPEFGWPLAIALGAIISPPDDVAILAIAEKVKMPRRIINVLKGEALLNDATALIIYRFALIAFITHQFSLAHSVLEFLAIIIFETIYGFVLANLIGQIRLKITDNSSLQMMISIITPFLAYLPAVKLAGSGVIATVATGFFIGNLYWERFPPEVRLTARSIWTTLSYGVQSILFLLVGLDFQHILQKNSHIPYQQLFLYSLCIVLVVIIGRFIWCFPAAYIPRWIFPAIRKNEPELPWQYPFVISWAGMRGAISLAAALAVPAIPFIDGIYPKELLIFFVFSVIIATLLIQGLSLPWLLKKIGVPIYGKREQLEEDQAELATRAAMTAAVLKWLSEYQTQVKSDESLMEEIKLRINEYSIIEGHIREKIKNQASKQNYEELPALKEKIFLLNQVLKIERDELLKCWQENKISPNIKFKLEQELDLRAKHLEDIG